MYLTDPELTRRLWNALVDAHRKARPYPNVLHPWGVRDGLIVAFALATDQTFPEILTALSKIDEEDRNDPNSPYPAPAGRERRGRKPRR
jgi:hypothetical protein